MTLPVTKRAGVTDSAQQVSPSPQIVTGKVNNRMTNHAIPPPPSKDGDAAGRQVCPPAPSDCTLSGRSVNKPAVAAAFGRAAQGYDRCADLQRYTGKRLLAHLDARVMPRVLDAGCGTGWFSRRWRDAGSDVTALDLSSAMLDYARSRGAAERYVLGDIEALPLADAGFNLAWSNLAVQWCSQLARGLAELYRVTRPSGYVAFSTLGQDSLHELHRAWRAVNTRAHANRFLTHSAIAAACPGSRYVLHDETVTLHFPDALSAMRSLKGIGATHLHHGRDGSLMTRAKLEKLNAAWPRDVDGLRLSYQLVFGVIRRD